MRLCKESGAFSSISHDDFFAVAGVMVLAHAEMLAAIQILVYLGSVMLVVQFGVMLTRRQIQEGDVE